MRTKNTASTLIRQHFFKKKLYDPNPIHVFRDDPVKRITDILTFAQVLVFNELLFRSNQKGYVVYTQEDVAQTVGVSQETVKTTEDWLETENVFIYQRHYKRPTLGRLSSYFDIKTIRRKLSLLLPALKEVAFMAYDSYTQFVNQRKEKFLFATSGDININNSDYDYLRKKKQTTNHNWSTLFGGVPPDIVEQPPSRDQIADFARIVGQLWSDHPEMEIMDHELQ